jgi:hypothetical protein
MPRDDNPQEPKLFTQAEVNEIIERAGKEALRQILTEHGMKNPYEQPAIDPNAPRAYTSEEVTEQLMESIAHSIHYWQTNPACGSMERRVSGVVHSVLSILDGRTIPLPAFDLVPAPHVEDKSSCIEDGENYYDRKAVISTDLTSLLYPTLRELYPETTPVSGTGELTPDEMRYKFVTKVSNIADARACSSDSGNEAVEVEKYNACHGVARDILQLIDGQYDADTPPFMLFSAQSDQFNIGQVKKGNPKWGSHIPLNRKTPTYGIEDSLVDAYDEYRKIQNQARRDMFK